MSIFAGAADVIATGLQLVGTLVVGPILWLAAPTMAPTEPSRRTTSAPARRW